MSKLDIIRAWKDKQYRNSLNGEQQALLPENPAGQIDLNMDELEDVGGATPSTPVCSAIVSVIVSATIYQTVASVQSYINYGTCHLGNSSGCC